MLISMFCAPRHARARAALAGTGLLLASALLAVIFAAQRGVTGRYFENAAWEGTPRLAIKDLNFSLQRMQLEMLYRTQNYSIGWQGFFYAPAPGMYEFATISDDASFVEIDSAVIVDNGGAHGLTEKTGAASLTQGFHEIKAFYAQNDGAAAFSIYWTPPGKPRQNLNRAVIVAERPSGSGRGIYLLHAYGVPALFALAAAFALLLIHEVLRHRQAFPLTAKLLIFLLLNGMALNLLLAAVSERTTLYYTQFFLTNPTHLRSDSWQPMYDAFAYETAFHENALYSTIFFKRGIKFQYPPMSLLLLLPLRSLPPDQIFSILNGVSWGMIWASALLLAQIALKSVRLYAGRSLPFWEKFALHLLAIAFTLTFYPVMRSFQLGQIQTWIYFLFVVALCAWLRGWKAAAGVCVGLIALMKPQLGVLMLWGALRKQWRFTASAAVTAAIPTAMSLWVFGLPNHFDYFSVLSFIAQRGESYYPNHSINGLLNRWLGNGANTEWNFQGFAPYHPVVYWGTMLSSLLIIGAALLPRARRRFGSDASFLRVEALDMGIMALSVTMASPVCWEHHYTVMLPLFALALPAATALQNHAWMAVMAAFMFSGNFWLLANRLAPTRWNFLQSYLLFGAIILLLTLYLLRTRSQSPSDQ